MKLLSYAVSWCVDVLRFALNEPFFPQPHPWYPRKDVM